MDIVSKFRHSQSIASGCTHQGNVAQGSLEGGRPHMIPIAVVKVEAEKAAFLHSMVFQPGRQKRERTNERRTLFFYEIEIIEMRGSSHENGQRLKMGSRFEYQFILRSNSVPDVGINNFKLYF